MDRPLPPWLRLDGLYVSPGPDIQGRTWKYLRFYADGALVDASVSAYAPERVAAWLTREDPTQSRGTWAADGQALSFTTTWSDVAVDYEGEALPDGALRLRSHSRATDHQEERTYTFVPSILPSAPVPLRFDGVYTAFVFREDGSLERTHSLRFYADGTAIGAWRGGKNPAELAAALTPAKAQAGQAAAGAWIQDGARVAVQLGEGNARIELEGERLVGGTLQLRARHAATGREADHSYRFAAL